MAKGNVKDQTGEESPGFSKKWAKHLSDSWKTSAESYSTEELKKAIVDCERAISNFEKDMDADVKIKGIKDRMLDLKEELKEVSEIYTVPLNECQAQSKYAVFLLESRGVAK